MVKGVLDAPLPSQSILGCISEGAHQASVEAPTKKAIGITQGTNVW